MRAVDIAGFATELGTRVLIKRPGDETARWYRHKASNLGTTFIKLGQLASTRSEIFSPVVIDELSLLRDAVDPLDAEVIQSVLDEDGVNVEIEPNPIGSASIGQVHKVKGMDYVVKVQRPAAAESVQQDLDILIGLCTCISQIEQFREISDLVREWGPLIKEELDYENEARNMIQFYKLYKHMPVVIPRVVQNLSTSRVLCMEYIPGHPIDKLPEGFNKDGVAYLLLKNQIRQVIEGGLVHCDPHPGNLALTEDGRIIYYDFGMMCNITTCKENLISLLLAVNDNDIDQVIKYLFDSGIVILSGSGDISTLKPFIRLSLKFLENGELTSDLLFLEKERPFRLTRDWSFLLRSFFLIDGLSTQLNPDMSTADVLMPYALELSREVNIRQEYIKSLTLLPRKLRNVESMVNETIDSNTSFRIKINSIEKQLNILIVFLVILFIYQP